MAPMPLKEYNQGWRGGLESGWHIDGRPGIMDLPAELLDQICRDIVDAGKVFDAIRMSLVNRLFHIKITPELLTRGCFILLRVDDPITLAKICGPPSDDMVVLFDPTRPQWINLFRHYHMTLSMKLFEVPFMRTHEVVIIGLDGFKKFCFLMAACDSVTRNLPRPVRHYIYVADFSRRRGTFAPRIFDSMLLETLTSYWWSFSRFSLLGVNGNAHDVRRITRSITLDKWRNTQHFRNSVVDLIHYGRRALYDDRKEKYAAELWRRAQHYLHIRMECALNQNLTTMMTNHDMRLQHLLSVVVDDEMSMLYLNLADTHNRDGNISLPSYLTILDEVHRYANKGIESGFLFAYLPWEPASHEPLEQFYDVFMARLYMTKARAYMHDSNHHNAHETLRAALEFDSRLRPSIAQQIVILSNVVERNGGWHMMPNEGMSERYPRRAVPLIMRDDTTPRF